MSALGHKASAEAPSPSWISGGRATAELDHGQFEDSFARFLLDERIIDQIVHALGLGFLGAFALGHVTSDLAGANDGATGVYDRRDAQ